MAGSRIWPLSRLTAIVLVLGALATGCTQTPTPATPTVATPGLRGAHLETISCPRSAIDGPTEPPWPLEAVPAVSEFVWCRRAGTGQKDRTVAPGQVGFDQLATFLGQPNQVPVSQNYECLDYANAPIQLLARTPTGQYWLEIPHDVCSHHLTTGLRDALSAAFGHD
jgi:hypothetical protein